jgi:hypothetical protein
MKETETVAFNIFGLTQETLQVGIVAILAIACTLPFAVSGYRLSQFNQVLIYAIAMLGLNILTGFNGQISLGQGAFYAIGAYTTAILLVGDRADRRCDLSWCWLSIRVAGAATRRSVSRPCPRRGDSPDSQIRGLRSLDRRRPGYPGRRARGALRVAAQQRPVDLLFLPDLDDRALHCRAQSVAWTHRPRDDRDPRPSFWLLKFSLAPVVLASCACRRAKRLKASCPGSEE